MTRLSDSRFVFVGCFVLCFGPVFAQNPDFSSNPQQLWKSFQEEMKTLEQAAHRVNKLLSSAQHLKKVDDSVAQPAENPGDVTVLGSPDVLKNGVFKMTEQPATEENDKEMNSQSGSSKSGAAEESVNHLSLGSFLNSFWSKNFPEPWWKGKNVCVKRSEKVEGNKGEKAIGKHVLVMGTGTFEHCKQTAGKYICTSVLSSPESTKTVSTTYQCCEGFKRQASGCVQVQLKDPIEVLGSLGSKEFSALLKSEEVIPALADKNITIFAPVDKAMRSHYVDFQESDQIGQKKAIEERNEIPIEQTNLTGQNIVLSHITNTLLDLDDLTNEMVIKSMNKDTPLRVNIYPGRQQAVMTINCARIQSWDNLASHARIHTIDRVLEPISQTISDIISQPQFSQFKQFIEQEGMMEMLKNTSAVTVFVPNNDAWEKLSNGLKDKYVRGEACIKKVLRHHILPFTLCSAPAMEGRLTTTDLDGEPVQLSLDANNQLMVDNKGRVIQEDIVITNGVVHVLDKVLIPKSAKPLNELLVISNHTTWLSLLDKAGIMNDLNRQENITMFVPTEQALLEDSTYKLLVSMDVDSLRRVLLYHITDQVAICGLRNQAELRSQSNDTLRVTIYNAFSMFSGVEPQAAVQCSPLVRIDGKACHVVAHEVSSLLLPPKGTVLQIIAAYPQLSVLNQIIKGTQVEKDIEEKSGLVVGGFSFLAPNNNAFNKLDKDLLSKLLTNKKFANEFIRMHILKEPVCCASIMTTPWPFINSLRTIDSKNIEINRDGRNRVLFGNSVTEKCDIIATDGILHIIDNVLFSSENKVKLGNISFGPSNRRTMLFGI